MMFSRIFFLLATFSSPSARAFSLVSFHSFIVSRMIDLIDSIFVGSEPTAG